MVPTKSRHWPAPTTNATVVKVCRRLVQATAERRFEIRWVKVKGHSGDEGNNAADVAAGWAQNGGTKGEKDIEGLMQRLRRLKFCKVWLVSKMCRRVLAMQTFRSDGFVRPACGT